MCYMCRMNVVTSTCSGQVFYNTQLVVHRAGMWPSSKSAEKPANTPVMSLVANHVNFDVENPTAYSTEWEASVNTIPAIDITIYTSRL